jgi:hypothetical protein
LLKVPHAPNEVEELKMRASIWALVSEPTVLIGFVLLLLSVQVTVIEHMDAYEVSHLVVHLLSFAKLKGKILVLLILLRLLGVFLQILKV